MNYLQIFAKGGKIDTKAIKSEIARIFMLEDSPEKVEQLWQDAVNTYGSEEGVLSEIFKQVGENPSDESVQQAMMNVLNYTPMEESQIFKCGGKLQQLVTKFGKGGGVDCGCGGIKLNQQGGITGPFNEIPKGYYNENGVFLGYENEPRTMEYINSRNNDRTWTVTHPTNLARFNNTINQSRMLWNPESLPEPYNVSSFTRLADGTITTLKQNPSINRSNYVETKQEGGIVYTDLPGYDVDTRLTRRQARELARVNGMSENNEQFAFAMANAMNAARAMGLRGAEARQRAREMAAGIKPTERSIIDKPIQLNVSAPVLNAPAAITAPEQLALPETQRTLDTLLDETNSGLARSLNAPRQRTTDSKVTNTSQRNTTNNNLANQQRRYLNDIAERATANPEWFWGDDESANQARAYLYNLKGGTDLIQQIYDNTPETLQQSINYKKLPHNISANRTVANQQSRTEQAGRNVAKGAAVLAGSLATAEALPYIINGAPEVVNGVRTWWNPVQSRVGTYLHTIGEGSGERLAENATGRIISRTGVNTGRYASGTDFAETIANNLRMLKPVGFKQGGQIEKAQNGYSVDTPHSETVVSPPTRMTLRTLPSANREQRDSIFTYSFDPDYTVRTVNVTYDKNGKPSYSMFRSDKRNGKLISEEEFEGYRNKWESLKNFYINNPEFNQRSSYIPFRAPIKLMK